MKCEDCVLCSNPEILNELHCMKEGSYYTTRIVSRCLASPHKYIIGSVCAKQYCKYKNERED